MLNKLFHLKKTLNHTACTPFYLYFFCLSRLSGGKLRSLGFKHAMKKMMPSMH